MSVGVEIGVIFSPSRLAERPHTADIPISSKWSILYKKPAQAFA